jgi:serine/threonine protein kinase
MQKPKARRLEGREIAGYTIDLYVDSGASADVYRATHNGRVVALKLYQPWVLEMAAGETKRLERETKSLQRIEHPNVCRFVDASVAEVDGERRPYLAMEFIPGSSLEEHVAQFGPMSWPIFRRHAISIVSGLAAIHAAGQRHRDLKPANIRIRDDGQPIIVDFGVVGNIDGTSSDNLTAPSEFLGTLRYAAPEWIFRNPPNAVDQPAVDVYGLGATFYEMTSGRRPFAEVENKGALTIAQRDRPLLFDLPGYPAEVVNLFRRMVQKDPARRPSVAEILALFTGIPEMGHTDAPEPGDYIERLQKMFGADEKASTAAARQMQRQQLRDQMANALASIVTASLQRLETHQLAGLHGLGRFEGWDPGISRWNNAGQLPFMSPAGEIDLIVRGVGSSPLPESGVIGVSAIYFLSGNSQHAVMRRVLAAEVGRSEGNYFDTTTLREWEGDLDSVVARAIKELPDVENDMGRLLYGVNKAKSAEAAAQPPHFHTR